MRRLAVLILFALSLAGTVQAAVRVVEDEVIFTISAPDAKDVYLVGDFNNWNPTVERMLREGDGFEISLFLVEGTYRYKFVVDGVWTDDPDNPARTDKGSVLTLIEQAGGLILSTEDPEAPTAAVTLTPGVRYIGEVRNESIDDTKSEQQIDLSARLHRDRLKGEVVLKSTDDTWKGQPGEVETKLNRGYLEAKLSGFSLRGYENDSTWASKDPVSLIGSDGLFRYNTGFLRHGAAAGYVTEKFIARVLYDDVSERQVVAPPTAPAWSGADTNFYGYDPTIGDADRLAAEIFFDGGDVKGGVVLREDAGLHPGRAGEVRDSVATLYASREDRRVSQYWLEVSDLPVVQNLSVAWGRGKTNLHRFERIVPGQGAGEAEITGVDIRDRLQKSMRIDGRLRGTNAGIDWRVEYDYVRFDFDEVLAPGRAEVHRPAIEMDLQRGAWKTGLMVLHTYQDYGTTPDALHIDSPERNHWLNAFDNFTVANIVGIDEEHYTEWRLDGSWQQPAAPWRPRYASTVAGLVTGGTLDGIRHAWAQGTIEWNLERGFYIEFDGRVASYDKPEWSLEDTFLSGYVEGGYRYRWLWINAGWGFDPYVLDPVTNDYARIGRTDLLRESLRQFDGRSSAAAVGAALGELERKLQGANNIYLECIIQF